MSPEIKVNGKTIATVPDETGTYKTNKGLPIYVNSEGIHADNNKQRIVIAAMEVGGRREIGLTHQGIGSSLDPKRGDGKNPNLEIILINKPIRVSYKGDHIYTGGWGRYVLMEIYGKSYRAHRRDKRTYKNPYWQK